MNEHILRVILFFGFLQFCKPLLFHTNYPIPPATTGPLTKDATISLLAQEILELKAGMRAQQLRSDECEMRIKKLEAESGNETSIIAHEISHNMEKLKETILNQQNNTSEFQNALKKLKEVEQLVKSHATEMQIIQGKLQQISAQSQTFNPSLVLTSISRLHANISYVESSLMSLQSIMTSVAENSTFVDTIFVPHRLRLMGGDWNAGRVEFLKNGTWGTICSHNGFDNAAARVICRNLGRRWQNAVAYYSSEFGVGTGPFYLDNVQCTGNEVLLVECQHNSYASTYYCGTNTQAGVRCQ